jgi:hypothetical protein
MKYQKVPVWSGFGKVGGIETERHRSPFIPRTKRTFSEKHEKS